MEKEVNIWDSNLEQCVMNLKGHKSPIRALTSLPSGFLASAGGDMAGGGECAVRIWNLLTGNCVRILSGHTNTVYALKLLPDGTMASGSWDKTVRIWDPMTGKCLRILSEHSSYVNAIDIFPDGRLVSGGGDETHSRADNSIRIWDAKQGQRIQYRSANTAELNRLLARLITNNSVKMLNISGVELSNIEEKLVELLSCREDINTTPEIKSLPEIRQKIIEFRKKKEIQRQMEKLAQPIVIYKTIVEVICALVDLGAEEELMSLRGHKISDVFP